MEETKTLFVQRMLQQKKLEKQKKKIKILSITVIILVLIILTLGATLFLKDKGINGAIKIYKLQYPDSVMSIQKITGETASSLGEQVRNYCSDFNLPEFYMAQFDNSAKQQSMLYILNPSSGKVECVIDRNAPRQQPSTAMSQKIVASVNGEPVYADELNAALNNIPPESRTNASLKEALDTIINNKLLLQDASKKGIEVSNEELTNAVNTFLTNNGLTIEQLQQNLEASGSSLTVFLTNAMKSLLLQKAIADITKEETMLTDEEILSYYEENKEGFKTQSRATTHQILIYANDSNLNDKLEFMKAIAEKLNETNFCELVTKYSEDTLSVERCGLYDFQQGQLLPEYEEIVFKSEPGSIKIVRTRLGLHLVRIDNVTLSRQMSFDEVKSNIKDYLILRKKQAALNQYLQQLRSEAEVINYIQT